MHINKEHGMRGEDDERILWQVRLQSWYGPKRERYWVVDVGTDGGSSGGSSGGTSERVSEVATERHKEHDEIEQGISLWQAKATERRLTLQVKPLAYELDSWLNFTKWHTVLSRSKYDMLRTYEFLRYPEPKDTRLHRLLRAWEWITAS